MGNLNRKTNNTCCRNICRFGPLFLFTFSLIINALFHASVNANTTAVLVQTYEATPDQNGEYLNFLSPSISQYGVIVFSANLINTSGVDSDDSGIFKISISSGNPSMMSINQVAREGSELLVGDESFLIDDLYPFASALLYDSPLGEFPIAGDLDNVLFRLPIIDSSGQFDNEIIVLETQDSLKLIAQTGDPIDIIDGRYGGLGLLGLGGNNEVTFSSSLDETDNPPFDNTAIFKRYNNDEIVKLVRKGDSANQGVFKHVAGIYTNNFGTSVFGGVNESENDRADSGLYKTTSSSYVLVVHEGDLAPIGVEENHYFSQLGEWRINNKEEVGFVAVMRDENGFSVPNGSGLFIADNLSVTPIILDGQLTPDETATFTDFLGGFSPPTPRPSFNDLAQFAFTTRLITPTGQSAGIFKAAKDDIQEIARKGEVYEGGTFNNFLTPTINNDGIVAFIATLAIDILPSESNEGGFATEDVLIMSDGTHLETIAKVGDEYGTKKITQISFDSSPRATANGLNDNGQVVYEVRYDDGIRAIHLFTPSFGWRDEVSEGSWDDIENWKFAGVPDEFSDVVLDFDQDLSLQGPAQATVVNSLNLGAGLGVITLNLQGPSLTATEFFELGSNANLAAQGQLIGEIHNDGSISVIENGILTITDKLQNDGQIDLAAGSEVIFESDYAGLGSIEGAGVASFLGPFQFGDTISNVQIGTAVNFASDSLSTLRIDGMEKGVGYDAFSITSSVNLSGTLEVVFNDNFQATSGNSFELLTASQITGSFDNIILPTLSDADLALSVEQTDTSLRLIVGQAAETPTPPLAPVVSDDNPSSSASGGSINVFWMMVLFLMASYRHTKKSSELSLHLP